VSLRRVVVVGHGMAGARLAENIRRRDPDGERVALTIVGEERHHAYNRILLSAALAGSLPLPALQLQDVDWAQRHHVDLRLGAVAVRVERDTQRVRLDDGSRLKYDALVLATGSRPWIPPTEGLRAEDGSLAPGVVAFRTLDDCEQIIDEARGGACIAVLGGGLLGLEAARALAARGAGATVVHPVGHVMERQLDATAGWVLARTLESHGIRFRLGVHAAKYVPGDGLKLDDGAHLPVDLVVVAAGVRPETALASEAGLTVRRGIVVDDCLRTSDPRVHAIGDCAQHPGTVAGLVQPAWEQADILADLLTDHHSAARYRGTPAVTRLKARGIELAALGETQAEMDDPGVETLCLQDASRGRYAKLVLRADRVVGAILLGAPDVAATITQLYERCIPAPSDRLALLLGRALPAADRAESTAAELPDSTLVCRCSTVRKCHLVAAWRAGAHTASGLATATRATAGCGGCTDSVQKIADWLGATETPVAPNATPKGSPL
jgi:assimilatory nitrate reductase electron transfer subunit